MLAAAAALVMAAVMATSAFAATSSVVLTPPAVSGSDIKVTAGNYDKGNSGVEVTGTTTAADVINQAKMKDKLPSGFSADKMQVAGAFDLTTTETIPADGAKVTVKVDGAAQGDRYVMLHFNTATSAWEIVGTGTVGAGGAVTGTFKSFSPVIVLTQAASSGSGSGSSSDKDDNDSSSSAPATQTTAPAPVLAPQTGVNSAETLAAAVVVAGVAVVAFAAKKIKE